MATLSVAGIAVALNVVFMDRMASQIRRDVLLPNLLEVKTDRNSTCTWTAKFTGRSAGGAFAEGADMEDADFDSDLRLQATLAWAQYRAGAKVSGLAEAVQAASGGNGSGDSDLLYDEIKDAIDKMAVDLSTHSYSGNVGASPPQIDGLARAVDGSTTYAGLNRGTYTEWASAENSMAAADLSIANLRANLHRKIKDVSGMYPEFVICPPDIFDDIGELFGDQRRYITEVTTSARGKVDLSTLSGGFRAIVVDGIPYLEDRHCTANTLYGLHSSALGYRQVPTKASTLAPSVVIQAVKDLIGVTLTEDEVVKLLASGTGRLQPTIEALSKTGDNTKLMCKVYAQLRVRYPGRCGKLLLT